MNFRILGSGWATRSDTIDRMIEEAGKEQEEMAKQVRRDDIPPFDEEGLVTGVDVSYVDEKAIGAAVTIDLSKNKAIRKRTLVIPCEFPYISGYFHLRESPVLISLLNELGETGPIFIDANGVLHQRRCGLASYVGIKSNRQTIGVAKSLLLGDIGPRRGDSALITDAEETVGATLWLGKENPLYVSIGHRITLETAIEIVNRVAKSGRPEPIVKADHESRRVAESVKETII